MLFCIPKAALLQGKRAAFGVQNLRFRNVKAQLSLFNGIIFYKIRSVFQYFSCAIKRKQLK